MKPILGPIPCASCHGLVTLRRPVRRRTLDNPTVMPLAWFNADGTWHNCRPRQIEVGL
jgi:hypothetical protein